MKLVYKLFFAGVLAVLGVETIVYPNPFDFAVSAPNWDTVSSGPEVVEFYATKDSSKASIKFSRTLKRGDFVESGTIVVSAPVKKGEDLTTLATLDAFINSSMLEAKWTKVSSSFGLSNNYKDLPVWDQYKTIYENSLSRGEVSVASNEAIGVNRDLFWEDRRPMYEQFLSDLFVLEELGCVYGASLSIGYENFDFRVYDTLEESSQSKVPYGGKVYGGIMPRKASTLFLLSFEFQNGFKDSDKLTFEEPVEGSDRLYKSITAPIGEPVENNKSLLSIETKSKVKIFTNGREIGISTKIVYDCENEEYAASVPIYFLRNGEGDLAGGIAFSWSESSDRISVGLFVGAVFNYF